VRTVTVCRSSGLQCVICVIKQFTTEFGIWLHTGRNDYEYDACECALLRLADINPQT